MPLSLPVFTTLSSALERAVKFYEGEIVAAGKVYGMEVTSFAPRSLQILELVWDRMMVCTSRLSYLCYLSYLCLSGSPGLCRDPIDDVTDPRFPQ